MPYYKTKNALSPITSDIITYKRVQSIVDSGCSGIGSSFDEIYVQINKEQEYKGFYLAKGVDIHEGVDATSSAYVVCLLEDKIDLRKQKKGAESPWVKDNRPVKDAPCIDQIEGYWLPANDENDIREAERMFLKAEKIVAEKYGLDVTMEAKLAAISKDEVDCEAVAEFCALLGRNTAESHHYIEEHVIFAAYNPHNYLQKNNKLEHMTFQQCKKFSWKNLVLSEYFRDQCYIDNMDWKGSADDVNWVVNRMLQSITTANKKTLSQRIFKTNKQAINLEDDKENYATYYWLEKASIELKALGWLLIDIDIGGDCHIITLMQGKDAKRFVELGNVINIGNPINIIG